MRILVTGADGQLGRSLSRALDQHQVTGRTHAELDITDADAVRAAIVAVAPDVVINAAAYNDVDGAESHAELAEAVNVRGPRILALESTALGIAIVHVSTDYVFDGRTSRPYCEHDAPNPLSAYGRSKLAGEIAVMDANPMHFIVRTAWLFAANGKNFLNSMRARAERSELRVVADQFGSPTYAPHLARGIARLIDTDAYGLYHMAGSGGTSRYDLVHHLFALLGIKTRLVPVSQSEFPVAATRPPYSVLATIRDAEFVLPPWQDGVSAFANEVRQRI
ncbi:MAG TPA: dTDP-4-dehydrorhamnose reductase [Candidatus Binataceae bacterium]|nr:dTDP-4-dehydrorhamnose reductase [Candidatus Binataceae bacterium]